jgi:hypothetical protein
LSNLYAVLYKSGNQIATWTANLDDALWYTREGRHEFYTIHVVKTTPLDEALG